MAQNDAAVRCDCWSGSFTEHTAECVSRVGNRSARTAPDPVRELAEWLAAQRPVVGVRLSVLAGSDARLNEAIARAREALGRTEEGSG